jgi:hypothetical protein
MLFRTAAVLFASSVALGAPAAYAAPEAPVAAHTVTVKAPQAAPNASSYAEREQQDPRAAEFQGGDTVVVGISGGAILVLLVLLLILA